MAASDSQASEAVLQDFLSFLVDYVPTLPDELVDFYATSSGLQCGDVGVRRLMSVATQKFVAEIAYDALRLCKMRQLGAKTGRDRKMTLSNEDLAAALKEYGIELKRPDYFADSPSVAAAAAPTAPPLAPAKDD